MDLYILMPNYYLKFTIVHFIYASKKYYSNINVGNKIKLILQLTYSELAISNCKKTKNK